MCPCQRVPLCCSYSEWERERLADEQSLLILTLLHFLARQSLLTIWTQLISIVRVYRHEDLKLLIERQRCVNLATDSAVKLVETIGQ